MLFHIITLLVVSAANIIVKKIIVNKAEEGISLA